MAKPKLSDITTDHIHLRVVESSAETSYWLVVPCGKGDIEPVMVRIAIVQYLYMRRHHHLSVYTDGKKEQSPGVKAGIAKRKANREAKAAKSAQDYSELCDAIMTVRRPKTTKEQRLQAIADDHKIIAKAAKRAGEEGNKKFFAKLGVQFPTPTRKAKP